MGANTGNFFHFNLGNNVPQGMANAGHMVNPQGMAWHGYQANTQGTLYPQYLANTQVMANPQYTPSHQAMANPQYLANSLNRAAPQNIVSPQTSMKLASAHQEIVQLRHHIRQLRAYVEGQAQQNLKLKDAYGALAKQHQELLERTLAHDVRAATAVQGEAKANDSPGVGSAEDPIEVDADPVAAVAQGDAHSNPEKRPASPKTPPTSPPAKRQKKEYSWLPISENFALAKAFNKIPTPKDQAEIERQMVAARERARQAQFAAFAAQNRAGSQASTDTPVESLPAAAKAKATRKRKSGSPRKNGDTETAPSPSEPKAVKPRARSPPKAKAKEATDTVSAKPKPKSKKQAKRERWEQAERAQQELDSTSGSNTATPAPTKPARYTPPKAISGQPVQYFYDDVSGAEDGDDEGDALGELGDEEPAYGELEIVDHNKGDTIAPLPTYGNVGEGAAAAQEEEGDPTDDPVYRQLLGWGDNDEAGQDGAGGNALPPAAYAESESEISEEE